MEALALGGGKRRGRPPAWMAKAKEIDAAVKESAQAKLGKKGANNYRRIDAKSAAEV